MIPGGSFANLRLNGQEGQAQERFWPSFTSIMMVIVMVFLLSLVILLVRNSELVGQLRATMEAERAAAEVVHTTGEKKEVLARKLTDAENQLSALRLQMMRADEERGQHEAAIESQSSQIKAQQQQLAKLTEERDLLLLQKGQLEQETARLKGSLKESDTTVAELQKSEFDLNRSSKQLEKALAQAEKKREAAQGRLTGLQESQEQMAQELGEVRKQHAAALKGLADLQRNYSKQSEELTTFRDTAHESVRELNLLRDEHEQLKTKYDKLIKPTRSPLGKQVVEVRYRKIEGEKCIDYKDAGQPEFKQVSREELEAHLTALKAQNPNGLYIKVTLPEDSGLTYNEAWSFTSELHKRYDYYFQTGAKPKPEAPKAEGD